MVMSVVTFPGRLVLGMQYGAISDSTATFYDVLSEYSYRTSVFCRYLVGYTSLDGNVRIVWVLITLPKQSLYLRTEWYPVGTEKLLTECYRRDAGIP